MRSRTSLAAALLVLGCLPVVASAQVPTRPGGIAPTTSPGYSPYLNLVRPGTSPAINYYGLVRPEVAFRNSIQGLRTDVDANRQLLVTGSGTGAAAGPLVTGHSAVFLNSGGYFLNSTGGAGPGRGGATAPARGATPTPPKKGR